MKGHQVTGNILALSADKPPFAVPMKVDRDKVTRAQAVTPLVEAGKVLLPERAGWLDEYLEEMSTFPSAAHDDYVNRTAQALNYLRRTDDGFANIMGLDRLMFEEGKAPA